jgi:hypothetical protein
MRTKAKRSIERSVRGRQNRLLSARKPGASSESLTSTKPTAVQNRSAPLPAVAGALHFVRPHEPGIGHAAIQAMSLRYGCQHAELALYAELAAHGTLFRSIQWGPYSIPCEEQRVSFSRRTGPSNANASMHVSLPRS